ncbi:hypothetical protein FB466_1772 [Klugiella xanthotipulae]|uniref:Uncharacterized protein n=1 Tax=Klugiella xanthotipulae TaxID=244735 RepID=A0A543HYS9_9MICO|nr:hypothetical protein FB466_1772 [Klugiella xanthotipulae]
MVGGGIGAQIAGQVGEAVGSTAYAFLTGPGPHTLEGAASSLGAGLAMAVVPGGLGRVLPPAATRPLGDLPTTAHIGGAPDSVLIYKALPEGTTDRVLRDGFDPADYPGSGWGYPNGRAYFGLGSEGERIATDYSTYRGYDPIPIEIAIPRADFDAHFSEHIGRHNGVPNSEVAIPKEQFDILNQYPRSLYG